MPGFRCAELFFAASTDPRGREGEDEHGNQRKEGGVPAGCAQVQAGREHGSGGSGEGCGCARQPDEKSKCNADSSGLQDDRIMDLPGAGGLDKYPKAAGRNYNQEQQFRLPVERRSQIGRASCRERVCSTV